MSMISFCCRHRFPSGFEIDLSFELTSRFTSLFGPSGSGKTSVLSIIAGLLRPQDGNVQLNDCTLLDTANSICMKPEDRNVGVVFQDALLFPHLTVERNLEYGFRHRRRLRRTVTFPHVVETLELGPLLQRYPRNLSGGEKQRVALGRALLSSPDLLMMDEPLASLDDPRKDRILTYLERVVADWNILTLFVTHNQAEVCRAAEWVVVIENGRMICAGPPNEALAQPGPLTWTNSTGPVNLLRIENIALTDGRVMACIGGQFLMLPCNKLPTTSPSFVQFRPSDVIIARNDVEGLSVRNHLRGRVCRVITVENAVFVAIDVGQILWAEVTPQAVAELQLVPDTQVVCLMKAHSLTLIS